MSPQLHRTHLQPVCPWVLWLPYLYTLPLLQGGLPPQHV